MKHSIPFLFLILLVQSVYSQSDSCVNYFSGMEIHSMTESKHSLWLLTECRIVEMRKDTNLINFYVHKPQTSCFDYVFHRILVDSMDNVWVKGFDGTFKYDGNTWDSVYIPGYFIDVDPQNNIWYTYSGKLGKYDGDSLYEENFPYSIYDIAFDSSNTAWIASSDGLIKYNNGIDTIYPPPLPNSGIFSVAIDSTGKLWVSGQVWDSIFWDYAPILARFDGITWDIYSDSAIGIPQLGTIYEIKIDQNQEVWGLGHTKIIRYKDSVWSVEYDGEDSWAYHNISDFLIDEYNRKWLGTRGKGLLQFDSTDWIPIRTSNSGLPGNSVKAIEVDKFGKIWVGTNQRSPNYTQVREGFAQFDGTSWTHYPYTSKFSSVPYHAGAIVRDKYDNIWVANTDNLYKYDGNTWRKYPVDLEGSQISMAIDASNHIWVASGLRDLKEFNGVVWTEHDNSNYGFNYGHYRKFVEVDQNNHVWIGTYSHLARYDHINWKIYQCEDQNGHNCWSSIQAIAFDKNNHLWLGSGSKGVLTYDGNTYKLFKTRNNGTAYHNVYDITVDDQNNVWIGTFRGGLLKYDGNVWIQYTPANSDILGDVINTIEIENNQIWIGSIGGLTRFDECGGDTIHVSVEIATSVSVEKEMQKSVSVYPNPFSDKLIVKYCLPAKSPVKFELLDLQGRVVQSASKIPAQECGEMFLETGASLPAGIYIGLLTTEFGVQQTKLVRYSD